MAADCQQSLTHLALIARSLHESLKAAFSVSFSGQSLPRTKSVTRRSTARLQWLQQHSPEASCSKMRPPRYAMARLHGVALCRMENTRRMLLCFRLLFRQRGLDPYSNRCCTCFECRIFYMSDMLRIFSIPKHACSIVV